MGLIPRHRPRECLFRSAPLRAVRSDIRRAGPHRGGLAEVDAVEPGQEVDDLAPDGARLDADPRVVAVDCRRVGEMPGLVAHQPHRSAGIGLAEHDAGRARVDRSQHEVDDLVGPRTHVGREDQSQTAALAAHPLDGRDRALGPLGHRRVVEVGVQVLVFLDEHQERAAGNLAHQPPDVISGDPGRGLQDRAEGRLIERKPGFLTDVDRPIRRTGECLQEVVGHLDRDQPGVLVFVHIEDDRAGQRVQQVARRDPAVGVPHHLERKSDVE